MCDSPGRTRRDRCSTDERRRSAGWFNADDLTKIVVSQDEHSRDSLVKQGDAGRQPCEDCGRLRSAAHVSETSCDGDLRTPSTGLWPSPVSRVPSAKYSLTGLDRDVSVSDCTSLCGVSSSMHHLTMADSRTVAIRSAAAHERTAHIVDFLDRETAKIDALIGKQEQLIATLREDRTATITHAVTKGLDSGRRDEDVRLSSGSARCLAHWTAGPH